jgi:hypothetical protein
MNAGPRDGLPRFASGYFVGRGPGYGLFHYRVRGRDLFGRTERTLGSRGGDRSPIRSRPGRRLNSPPSISIPGDFPSAAAASLPARGPIATAAAGDPRRAAVMRPLGLAGSRQLQFPDLDEFRLYYRAGSLNHVLGRITAVTEVAPRANTTS